MIRDPLYRQIVDALKEGQFYPDQFELCAADLLRSTYPTLVPVPGGTDAGMDGVTATRESFLVTTTGEKVIGNLTRNLKSKLASGQPGRKVLLATSQALTQRRKENLRTRASELGFKLVQVYDQQAMALLLYGSSSWCRDLLHLTGTPPALSAVPVTARPLLTQPLIGREADLSWLCEDTGDRLLVGQPGSGKTFLLYRLTQQGLGLFVVSKDRGEIAGALRSEKPAILIVDDAQRKCELIADLRQMRQDIYGEFSIVASCWPGEEVRLAEVLGLPKSRVRRLELLALDEIVEVVKGAGLYGPDHLVQEIVDQAEGRPGLAATLAHLCLQGGIRQVILGDALSESVQTFFEPRIGRQAIAVLAAFSVGGDSGMSKNVVASELGVSRLELWQILDTLATGGVIWEVDQERLSVHPAALRDALVRDVFFRGARLLDVERFWRQAPSLGEVALTLVRAKARGAAMPHDLLIEVLEVAGSIDAWQAYAWSGREEAKWVLTHHPELLMTVARAALHRATEAAIPLLLDAAVGDRRPLHATPEAPLRLIENWVCGAWPGVGEAFRRRRLLFESARDWLVPQNDPDTGLRAFQLALSPRFTALTPDPGMGLSATLHSGSVSMDEARAIQSLWPQLLDLIGQAEITDWAPVRRLIEEWAYPGRLPGKIPADLYDSMRAFAGEMLRDVVSQAADRLDVLYWARRIAQNLHLDIAVPSDPDLETLYPREALEDWRARQAEQVEAVRELAAGWSRESPGAVAARIAQLEQAARLADARYPRLTPLLCAEIAAQVASRGAWIRAMMEAGLKGDLIEPFLRRAAESDDSGWVGLAYDCLDDPSLKGSAVELTLTLPNPPSGLLAKVLSNLAGYAEMVRTCCVRGQVSEGLVGQLLRHEDPAIASAAAYGEWHAEPDGAVRDSLYAAWRNVVAYQARDDYWLSQVLKDDPNLAYDWLGARLEEPLPLLREYERATVAAVAALSVEARREMLHRVPAAYGTEKLVNDLVGASLELYRELLNDERLKRFHVVPLSGHPEGAWVEKAKLVLDAGYTVEQVADAVYPLFGGFAWSGNESNMWAGWVERFDPLCSHEDERIRKIGEVGKAKAEVLRQKALKRERYEAVYGLRFRPRA